MRATLAVILARGVGSRLRADDGAGLDDEQLEAAAKGTKGLMPIGRRPFLDYVLHELAEAGVRDVVFVIAPDDESIRRRYDDDAAPSRIRVRYAVQEEPRGTADALLCAREPVLAPAGAPRDDAGYRHFLVCNSDNLYPADAVGALVDADGPGLVGFDGEALVRDGGIDAERLARFALLTQAADGSLAEIVEKPDPGHPLRAAPGRLVSMNLWRFTDAIFDACATVAPSSRGELELVDAVRAYVARGGRLAVHRRADAVLDLTHRRDVAALEARLAGRSPKP